MQGILGTSLTRPLFHVVHNDDDSSISIFYTSTGSAQVDLITLSQYQMRANARISQWCISTHRKLEQIIKEGKIELDLRMKS